MERHDLSKITTYQAGATQAYVNRKLQKICDAILEPFGVTKMQWMIIGHVYDGQGGGVRISDLAETLGTNMPYLTNSINLLESRGILERKEHGKDSRSKLVVVSKSFATKCDEIEATLRDGLRKTIYADVDPVEFSIYIKVQNQLGTVEAPLAKAKTGRKK